MTSAFETAGFKISPLGTTQALASQPSSNAQNPLLNKENQDKFIKQEREAIKAEVKEELKAELKKEQEKSDKKAKKKGGLNKFIANVKKVGVGIQEYAKGFGRGIINGGIIGGIGFGGFKLAQKLDAFKSTKPEKLIGKILRSKKTPIGLGIAGAVIGMTYQMWQASLNANERNAEIDHRYNSKTHNQEY